MLVLGLRRTLRGQQLVRQLSSSIHVSSSKTPSRIPADGKKLGDFVSSATVVGEPEASYDPESSFASLKEKIRNEDRSFFVETYGCAMNESDTEIVRSILQGAGYSMANGIEDADIILANTCAIRDKAEQTVWNRLKHYQTIKRKRKKSANGVTVGVLGCMAERLKTKLLEADQGVDMVVGPDSYRDLPRLLNVLHSGEADRAANVQLSQEETYADITPVRRTEDGVSSFVSVMRGCNNMCSFCIVPFTRGRERSRSSKSIVSEVQSLSDQGIKEVVLLGQNVNSYHDKTDHTVNTDQIDYTPSNDGFINTFKSRDGSGARFADLLAAVSDVDPEMRVRYACLSMFICRTHLNNLTGRFTSPHPKDFPPQFLQLVAERQNLCSQIHMPAQSGSTEMLKRMR